MLYRLVQRRFPWPLGAFGNSRSFVSIGNLAYIIKRLVSDPVEAGIYQVADDETLSTNELIGLIGESLGIKTRILKIPKPVNGALAKSGDMLHYFKIAGRYNIVDKPNHRSSHSFVTLRGGGVVYWMAALVFVLFNRETAHWLFFGGLTLIALISFYDDVKETTPVVRMVPHFVRDDRKRGSTNFHLLKQ